MATSSRIFVKGLPPTFTESEFRKHFTFSGRETTEIRLFSNRRIGYVGYKTSEDAQRAVKYFNKSFVRMSRIGVELARPPTAIKPQPASDNTSLERPAPSVQNERHDQQQNDKKDPKLQEFLSVMKPASKKRAWESDVETHHNTHTEPETGKGPDLPDERDDSEYEDLASRPKRQKQADIKGPPDRPPVENAGFNDIQLVVDDLSRADTTVDAAVTDADWARNRTSRLLGLLDEDEEENEAAQNSNDDAALNDSNEAARANQSRIVAIGNMQVADQPVAATEKSQVSRNEPGNQVHTGSAAVEEVRKSMRLFLRNLSYEVKAEDIEQEFLPFGNLEEVHVAMDKKTGKTKGFAYVQFSDADAAEKAFSEKDGHIFQGRLLHILPASSKRDNKLNDYELSKLPLKKQHDIQRRRNAASVQFNWNTLYMNADAVVSSVASQLGIAKSDVLDPTSSDAAVKQAHAETHIIQETKAFFKSHGVDLDAFKRSQRGDTAILVKNLSQDVSRDELKRLFEEHGEVRRFLMPPNGLIAIIEMSNAAQARLAFGALAYRKVKSTMLFLEKAPANLFSASATTAAVQQDEGISKNSTADLKLVSGPDDQQIPPSTGSASLFVRNLNFTTTSAQLVEAFEPLSGFMHARVKTRIDPKRPNETLSMGFGFLEFRNAADAEAAIRTMDGFTLHGHKLQVRASRQVADAAEERRKADRAKQEAGRSTKIIIKNLPFEATKKDVRSLFSAYGQLRSVRVPRKMDRAARGFAFADFTTPKEAQSAMDSLGDTHLLGRRLVLDFAEADPVDAEAEIEKMAAKVGDQANAVAVQRLTGQGRKKFTTAQDDEEEND